MMDDSKTVWCGNLSDQVTEELLYELFLQAAPLEKVRIPTDREGRKSNFGFITFKHEESVSYVLQLLNGTRLFDKALIVKPRNGSAFNKPADRNSGRNDFQNERINQLRMGPTLPRYDHSPNRFSDNRQGYGNNNNFRDREDRHHDWDNRKNFQQHDRRNDSPNQRHDSPNQRHDSPNQRHDSPNQRHDYHEGRHKFNDRHNRRHNNRYY
ncbi:hypothetical protein JTB14_034903 [Gonioctena quinquepunctata]|nr:hypothetical protein JTB14_034903 [Gonioctena quinquepunctata]